MTLSLQLPLDRSSRPGRQAATASALLEAGSRLEAQSPASAHEFRRFAAAPRPPEARVVGETDALASAVQPLGTVVFVFTPDCDAPAVARHIAAALIVGNGVECVLLGETDAVVLQIYRVVGAVLPEVFAAVDTRHGMAAASSHDAIVIVTSTQAFRNDEPWIRAPHDGSPECVADLSRFYESRSTA